MRTASSPTSWRRSASPPATASSSGEHVDVKPGNAMPLGNMPVGTIVHNIEIKIGKGGQIARSAGTYAQIVGRDGEYVILRLNSGEQRLVHGRCMATDRRGVESRQHEHLRSARPAASAGWAACRTTAASP